MRTLQRGKQTVTAIHMAACLLTGSAQKAIQQNQVPSIQHKNSATSGTISKCKSDMFLICKGTKHELKEIQIIHVKKSEVLLDNGTIKPTSHQREWMQK
jgi:hypothetical protein